ncbi:MAG TPA: MFS transporter [Chitinophagaceae bacterium]|nr:MFS transporter [Chitinophagaceae bacterium]
MSTKEKILLVILASINFTHILDFMIMMPLGNYLMPYFKISTQQFTLLVAAYTLSAGISGFIAAFFVDRFDRKKILLVGYAGFLLGTIACGFAPSYHWLLAARLLAGVFGGLIGAQVLSIVSDVFDYERRGAAMGAVMSSFSIASTIGVPFALYLANLFSWHAPFLLVGFLGIALLPLIYKYVPAMNAHIEKRENSESKLEVFKIVLRNPIQRLALLFSGMIMMGHFLIIPFINPYLEFNNGYSKTQTPMVYLVGGIAAFFAANILGKLSDRYGKLKIFTICILLSLPLVIVITMLPPISFSIVLVLFALWFIVATGRGVTAQALISNVVEPQKRGSFMSFNSSVQQLGTAAASLIAGFIVIGGSGGKIYRYEWLGYLSVFILLICAYLGYKIFRSPEVKVDAELHTSEALSDHAL